MHYSVLSTLFVARGLSCLNALAVGRATMLPRPACRIAVSDREDSKIAKRQRTAAHSSVTWAQVGASADPRQGLRPPTPPGPKGQRAKAKECERLPFLRGGRRNGEWAKALGIATQVGAARRGRLWQPSCAPQRSPCPGHDRNRAASVFEAEAKWRSFSQEVAPTTEAGGAGYPRQQSLAGEQSGT